MQLDRHALDSGIFRLGFVGACRCLQLGTQVKDNFDRFISCKNTIDDIHLRLRSNESGGNSTSHVAEAMQEVLPGTYKIQFACVCLVSAAPEV